MGQTLTCINVMDSDGNPTGGSVSGTGINIAWQDGPLQDGETRLSQNGAFIEDILEAVAQRLRYFQASRFVCTENALALSQVEMALLVMKARTADRVARGVEGTHKK